MSSPDHPTTDIEDAFSFNFSDYTMNSPSYFPASLRNISLDPQDNLSKYLLASLAILPFHDMQAYNAVANKPPIPLQDLITPPTILTPSPVLPPSLLFDPRYFFVPEELLPPKKQIHTLSFSLTTISNSSRKQAFADSVATALEAQTAMMASSDNPNRNSRPRKNLIARKFTYEKFMSFQPFYFNGTKGAIGLIHWFKQTESVFSRSNCAKKNKVNFAINTFIEEAIFWWNSFSQSIGVKKAYKITWSEFKRLLIKKYCPQTGIKKIEEAISMTQKLIEQKTCNNDKSLSEIQIEYEKEDEFVMVVMKVVHEYCMMVVKKIVNRLLEEVEKLEWWFEQDIDDEEGEHEEGKVVV
nr:reverse transcriptase domain-containing protein [Tanacetum cinerariifolium]